MIYIIQERHSPGKVHDNECRNMLHAVRHNIIHAQPLQLIPDNSDKESNTADDAVDADIGNATIYTASSDTSDRCEISDSTYAVAVVMCYVGIRLSVLLNTSGPRNENG